MNFKFIVSKAVEYTKIAWQYSKIYFFIIVNWFKNLTVKDAKRYGKNILSCLLIATIFYITAFTGGYTKSEKFDLFSSHKIAENIRNLELNMTSVIYVKNSEGKWEEYKRVHGDENRIWISLKKIPENLQNAFIAIEDEDFRNHGGVDWQRTFMALANQVFEFSGTEFGGSTITQQLIKNITSDKARDYKRKVREIIRALSIENELSKDQILEAYLNTIALGNGINGVQVAANNYFSKEVDELTLAECAAIAAITKNPSKYNPISDMEENTERRRVVLRKMLELGHITQAEFYKAYFEEVKLDFSQKEELDAEINDYFVDTLIEDVIDDLSKKYDCEKDIASQMFYNGGFKIYSTMNPEIQSIMEETYLKEKRYFYETRRNDQGERERVQSAMTIMDYNGHIVGIVGGTGKKTVNRGLNRAYNVPRQPGSTMKPLGVYALAIENDIVDYTSTVLDQPVKNYYSYGKPGPKEWFGEYMDKVPLNYALRHSMNAVPVRLIEKVGIEESYSFLTEKLNFKHLTETDKSAASLALGGCTYGITPTESAAAFAIFGNGGVYYEPTTYYKVVDINGEIILEEGKGERAIGEDTATIMNHMLREVVYKNGGTGNLISSFSYKMKAYAKTGTSSDTKDSWLVGGTPYYVGSVWYGFDHNQRVYNTNAAKTIWRDIMRKIHDDLEKREFTDSEDVYKKGEGYYKNGTKPGKVLKEEEYLPEEELSSQTSSTDSTVSSLPSNPSDATSTESTDSTVSGGVSDGSASGGSESGGTGNNSQSSTPDTPPGDSSDNSSQNSSVEPVTP